MWIPLNCHSFYSLLRGEGYMYKARQLVNMLGVLVTDKGPFVVKGRIEKDCGTVTALWLGRMKAVGMQGVNQ